MSECGTSSSQCSEEYKITVVHLLAAAALFLVNWLLSTYLSLGLNKKLLIAGIRCARKACVIGQLFIMEF